MQRSHEASDRPEHSEFSESIGISETVTSLLRSWRFLAVGSLGSGAIAFGISYLIPPTFTARTVFLPPQPPQSVAASTLASLGALSGLAGGSIGGIKTTADQYASFMQSANVQDRLIERFDLIKEYGVKFKDQARRELSENTRINIGKKDGLMSVEADASNPKLAADLANQHVAELRRLTGELALTEAQQRRAFFETELKNTRERLAKSQQRLQDSGFNSAALKAEPKAAAENYGRLRAEVTAAEVKLQTQRRIFAENTTEVTQQAALLGALQAQLKKVEDVGSDYSTIEKGSDYISLYREYRYQESLYELFSKQFEVARLDESREGSIIQVIDVAREPERRSGPKRGPLAGFTTLIALLILSSAIIVFKLRSRRLTA